MKKNFLFIAILFLSSILFAQNVTLIKNLAPADEDGVLLSSQIVTFNFKTYFAGNDGSTTSYFLFSTNGTAQGTKRVSTTQISNIEYLTVNGNLLYFSGYEFSTGLSALFTVNKTGVITKIKSLENIVKIVPFGINGAIFIQKDFNTSTYPFWKTDGTTASTVSLGSFDYKPDFAHFSYFNKSIIIAEQSTNSVKFAPIITDGTVAGTKKLIDFLKPVKFFETIESVTSVKDRIFVSGEVKNTSTGDIFYENYATDGTTTNTYKIDQNNFENAFDINNNIFVVSRNDVKFHNSATKSMDFIADKGYFGSAITKNGKIFFNDSDNFVWSIDGVTKKAKKISAQSSGTSYYDPKLFAKGDSIFYSARTNAGIDWRVINLVNGKDDLFTNFTPPAAFTMTPTMEVLGDQFIFTRVTNAEGSELWSYTGITIAPLAVAVKITTPIKCNGGMAQLDVSTTGGTAPYTYKWSDTKLLGNTPNAIAGTYSVTVTDSKNSTITTNITVTQPTAIVITTTIKQTVAQLKNGTATAVTTGGVSPFTYLWSTTPAQTTPTAVNLDKGNYTVTVTDANQCTSVKTVSITTGVNEVWEKYKFEIYPNPVSEWLNIKFESTENTSASVSIIDMNGKIVQEQLLDSGSKSINISKIPEGIYILKCNFGTSEIATSTIVIQR